MKKLFTMAVIAALTAGCKDAEPHRDTHSEHISELSKPASQEQIDRVYNQWREGVYATGKPFRTKELTRVSYSNSRELNSSDIAMRVVADRDLFSFEIFPKNTEVNKNHIGGYTITAAEEGGEMVVFQSKTSGRAVISREGHRESYEAFHKIFRDSHGVRVVVRDGYVSVYRGWLDTRYY